MSNPMSFQEFHELLVYISKNNSPFTAGSKRPSIKYVDPHMDMRMNNVFAVTLRGFGSDDMLFHTQNECRDLDESLDQRIRTYLNTPRGEYKIV